jgi:nicotinate-nucleotide pyrophosphorylase (carboxylating)
MREGPLYGIDELIHMALKEDIGPSDITTDALVDPALTGRAEIVAKEALVLCGLAVARRVFQRLNPSIALQSAFDDGEPVAAGQVTAELCGPLYELLRGERTALNFLQRLSGIATQARAYSEAVKQWPVIIVDTRKTTPGWRTLEKYAVRCGGAANHRFGLYDGVLIKDNHIAVGGGIRAAVEKIRARVSHLVKIEVEVADLDQVEAALAAGADVIMLDNMDPSRIRQAVRLIDHRARVEVSGGVTLENVRELAATGVDLISVGALTHSARAVDLSMRIFADP